MVVGEILELENEVDDEEMMFDVMNDESMNPSIADECMGVKCS